MSKTPDRKSVVLTVRRVCLLSDLRVEVPWGEIRGTVWGPDQGRPVLCLHGWADNCGSFNTLIPLLPQGELLQNTMETWRVINAIACSFFYVGYIFCCYLDNIHPTFFFFIFSIIGQLLKCQNTCAASPVCSLSFKQTM